MNQDLEKDLVINLENHQSKMLFKIKMILKNLLKVKISQLQWSLFGLQSRKKKLSLSTLISSGINLKQEPKTELYTSHF